MAANGKRAGVAADAFISDGTSLVVAHPMGPHRAPLGLDRPIALLGGGRRLAPDGIPSVLGIDHAPGLRNFVASACRRQKSLERDWYWHPPLALLGERGVGKGMVAHWIARTAGVPLFRAAANELVISGKCLSDGTNHSFPSVPVTAMAASCCANPVIVLEFDGDAPPTPQVETAIANMIDPRSNARWIDEDLGTIFDLSHVSWIIEVQAPVVRRDPYRYVDPLPMRPTLPPSLARIMETVGSVIELEASSDRQSIRRLDVAIAVCASSGFALDGPTIAQVHASLCELELSEREPLPCANLIAHAQNALTVVLSHSGR